MNLLFMGNDSIIDLVGTEYRYECQMVIHIMDILNQFTALDLFSKRTFFSFTYFFNIQKKRKKEKKEKGNLLPIH